MVKINNFPERKVALYQKDSEKLTLVDWINEEQLNDIRFQVLDQQNPSYFVEFMGEFININLRGDLDKWPYGMFTHQQEMFAKIVRRKNEIHGKSK